MNSQTPEDSILILFSLVNGKSDSIDDPALTPGTLAQRNTIIDTNGTYFPATPQTATALSPSGQSQWSSKTKAITRSHGGVVLNSGHVPCEAR